MTFPIPRTAAAFVLLACALLVAPRAQAGGPARYVLDPTHTYPSFEADHIGISYWRGKFNHSQGTLWLDKSTGTGRVEVEIDPASIDFGLDALNQWAAGPEFLDVARFPQARYTGRLQGFDGTGPMRVVGRLTLHGVTRPVDLVVDRFKCMPHPLTGADWCGADASGRFDRAAFGLNAGKDYGFDMQVRLRIQVEATLAGDGSGSGRDGDPDDAAAAAADAAATATKPPAD